MSFHLQTSRRQTFHKTRKASLKPLNWPHPLVPKSLSIHADKLSQAGFIHTPTLVAPDLTTCFLCAVVVHDWTTGQDPWEKHRTANEDCAFVKMAQVGWEEWKDQTQWDWGLDGVDWPRSERMDRARLETFAVGWPHEGVAGIPTKEEIAAAGMYFKASAQVDEADNCVCPYCARAVSQWEAGDDPLALHRRKAGVNCPFFIAPDPRPTPTVLAKKIKSTDSLSSKKGKKVAVVVEKVEEVVEKIVQMDLETPMENEPIIEDLPIPAPKKSRAKTKKSAPSLDSATIPADPTSKIPKPTAPVVVAEVADVVEVEEVVEVVRVEEEVAEFVGPKSRAGKGKGKAKGSKKSSALVVVPVVAVAGEVVQQVEEEAMVVDSIVEEIVVVERESTSLEVNLKINSPLPVAAADGATVVEMEMEIEVEAPKPTTKKGKKKGTKSKKTIIPLADEPTDDPFSTTTTTTSTQQSPLKLAQFSTFLPSAHPFPIPTLPFPSPTTDELKLTLSEWYTLCGNRAIEEFEKECRREEEVFIIRLEEATARVVGLRDEALRREERKRGKV